MLLLLVACQDYTLDDQKDDPVGFDSGTTPFPDDTGTTAGPVEACNGVDDDGDGAVDEGFPDTDADGTADCVDVAACALDVPVAGSATDSVSCGAPPVADPWNVALRDQWTGPDSVPVYMSEQLATGNLDDDNGDGRVDGDDVSDIVLMVAHDVCVSAETRLLALSGDDLHTIFDVTWPWLDLHTSPAVGDVDGDGSPDIVVQTDMTTTVMFDAEGNQRWESEALMQYNLPGPSLADLEGDGDVEVLVSKAVLDGATGDVERILVDAFGGAAVASDLDQDGESETLYDGYVYDVHGNVVGDVPWRAEYLAVLDNDGDPATGETVWTYQDQIYSARPDWREQWWHTMPGIVGPPTVADLDGDGAAEVVATVSGGLVVAWDKAGTEVWRVRLDFEGSPGIAAGDLDRDGDYELVLAGRESLLILDGDGTTVFTSPTFAFASTPEFSTYPLLTDLDDDGSAEILHVIEEQVGSQWTSQLLVWSHADGAWPPTADAWSQYSFTASARNDDLTVPAAPAPSWVGAELFRGWPSDAAGRPDLRADIVDVCAESCEADSAVGVSVQVANVGVVDAPPGTPVAIYREDGSRRLLAVQPLPSMLRAGATSDGLVFTLTVADLGTGALVVVADDAGDGSGMIEECDDGDNEEWKTDLPCR